MRESERLRRGSDLPFSVVRNSWQRNGRAVIHSESFLFPEQRTKRKEINRILFRKNATKKINKAEQNRKKNVMTGCTNNMT